ncbi:MAG: hypothetical protein Q9218_002121 [Villophora microphyllina]
MEKQQFRVIIVGAGVSGLVLAHALELANIDFVLLEKGIVAPPWGTSITILYDELPDKSKVLTGKRVKNVVDNEDEACVELEDGTVEHGDLIVGGDGVHSTVRKAMWEIANKTIPNFISKQEKETMVTTYSCLLGIAPQQPGIGINDMVFVCNKGYTFQFLTQPDQIYFMIHHKLPEPVRWPDRVRYTEKDAEEVAAKFAEHPISDSLVFGDLWRNRSRGHLISLEEGVLEHFYFGRTVLIGDAAHKVTPNAAMGGASAMEDSIALANTIHKLTRTPQTSTPASKTQNSRPSKQQIKIALQAYQDERKPRLKKIHDESAFVTRLQSYDTWFLYLLMRWVLPLIGLAPIVHNVSKLGAAGPRLEYVDVKEERGTIPWVHPMPDRKENVEVAA